MLLPLESVAAFSIMVLGSDEKENIENREWW